MSLALIIYNWIICVVLHFTDCSQGSSCSKWMKTWNIIHVYLLLHILIDNQRSKKQSPIWLFYNKLYHLIFYFSLWKVLKMKLNMRNRKWDDFPCTQNVSIQSLETINLRRVEKSKALKYQKVPFRGLQCDSKSWSSNIHGHKISHNEITKYLLLLLISI